MVSNHIIINSLRKKTKNFTSLNIKNFEGKTSQIMNKQNSKHINWIKLCGLLSLILGSALLVFMVRFEDEPGALPLLLIIIGITTLIVDKVRKKRT